MTAHPPADRPGPGAVFAHRGNRVAERENTIAAFRSAAAAGAAGIELDVRRTVDQHLVVHHDAVVDGVGAIFELPFAELRQAAPWLPTLPEALDVCRGLWVNAEIKNHPDDPDWDPQRAAVPLITSLVLDPARLIISSFDWETVAMTAALGWASAYLVSSGLEAAIDRAARGGMRAINPRADLVTAELVETARKSGLWTMAWTVNDEPRARELRDMGVEVIFTDDPARLLPALG